MAEQNLNELVPAIAAGNEEAFRDLYLALYPRLVSAALQVSSQSGLAEEVTQDLFLWMWRKREKLTAIHQIEDYLFRSIYQNMKQAMGKESLRGRRRTAFIEQRETAREDSQQETIIAAEERDLRRLAIEAALDLLSPQQRQIIHLRFMERKSYAQISKMLFIKEQVARNVAYRALKKLRERARFPHQLLGALLAGVGLFSLLKSLLFDFQ